MKFLYYMITIMCALKLQPATCKLDIFLDIIQADIEVSIQIWQGDMGDMRGESSFDFKEKLNIKTNS